MISRYFLFFLFLLALFRLIGFYLEDKTLIFDDIIKSNSFKAVVCQEPERYFDRQEVVLCLKNKQKFLARLETWPRLNLFDTLYLSCDLKNPENYSDFDYKGYLEKQGISKLCFYPQLQKIESYTGKNWSFKLWQIKEGLVLKIDKNLEEPVAGILKAMLLGLKSELEPSLKEALTKLGLAHLLAVSGLHLGLLVYGLKELLNKLRLRKVRNFLLLLFLIFYIFLIGAPISAIRAGFMISFLFLFKEKNLKRRFWRCLFLMLSMRPSWLREVGFQLSFMAVAGIVFILPKLEGSFWYFLNKLIFKLKRNKILKLSFTLSSLESSYFKKEVIRIILASLAVNILIWPLLVYYFKSYNYLFLLYNLLVLPVLPLFLIFGILGLLLPVPLLGFMPVLVIGKYIEVISSFKAGYFETEISKSFLLIYYCLFIVIYFISKKKFLKIKKNFLL
ncbi:MAG: ComEC/Rec2 family competence protein [Candidatus Pacebacteria bacterium]|nr:ComEC/Rec2 family competence protein [Candidatus Paceibacterota bacterium]